MVKSRKIGKEALEQPTSSIVRTQVETEDLPPAQGGKYQLQCPVCRGTRSRTVRNLDGEGEHRARCNVCKSTGLLPYDWETHAYDTDMQLTTAIEALERIALRSEDKVSRNVAHLALVSIRKQKA